MPNRQPSTSKVTAFFNEKLLEDFNFKNWGPKKLFKTSPYSIMSNYHQCSGIKRNFQNLKLKSLVNFVWPFPPQILNRLLDLKKNYIAIVESIIYVALKKDHVLTNTVLS